MKILLAGAGAFGREHLVRLVRRPGLTLAVADPDPRSLAKAGALAQDARTGVDAQALIAGFCPDGVIVASPAATHAPIARAALAAGIAVLVEKPLATSVAEARDLSACAAQARNSGFLLPGHILRFSAPHRALYELAVSGALGRLLTFTSQRMRHRDHARLYRGIDPVLMTMIHDIDLALWIGGSDARTAGAVRRNGPGGASLAEAEVEARNGLIWRLTTGWLHDGPCAPDRIGIIGTDGSAEWEDGGSIRIFGRSERIIDLPEGDDPLGAEIDAFLDAIANGPRLLPVTPADAVAGLEAADMILAALAKA